jgi:hypothetical protein
MAHTYPCIYIEVAEWPGTIVRLPSVGDNCISREEIRLLNIHFFHALNTWFSNVIAGRSG